MYVIQFLYNFRVHLELLELQVQGVKLDFRVLKVFWVKKVTRVTLDLKDHEETKETG